MNISFSDLSYIHNLLKAELRNEFEQVLSSNSFILGDKLQLFENAYSQFNQVNYTAGVSNGYDALFLSLKALGIGPGDEVIIPSNTFIATALAVSHIGATPVFAEPYLDTYNIDPNSILSLLTRKTKAIIPVHLFGQAAEMNAIMKIAEDNSLYVIEDNAQAQGATYKGQLTGSFGQINATSFYPGKNLGAFGDAGAITTNDSCLFDKVKILRNYGSSEKYLHQIEGYNMRLDELQAAFLLVKLNYLTDWIAQRHSIAQIYMQNLYGVGDLILPINDSCATHVYHLFVVRTSRRDELKKHLEINGIKTLIHYPVPPHLQGAYKALGYSKGSFPIAELLSETSISLPIWVGISESQLGMVIEAIKKFY